MRKFLLLTSVLILILSVFSISIVSAQDDCNLWCKIKYLFTGQVDVTGNVIGVQETETNIALLGTASAACVSHGRLVSLLNDGIYGSPNDWICESTPNWAMITLPQIYKINKAVFSRERIATNIFYSDRDPGANIRLLYSIDGVNFNQVPNVVIEECNIDTGVCYAFDGDINIRYIVRITFDAVDAKYVKLDQLNAGAAIDEFEIFESPAPEPSTCPDGMVSYWKADGDANDEKGAYNGQLVNGATFAAGKSGQAFSLNGVNQYVNLGDTNLLEGWEAYTIEAWIKGANLCCGQAIFSNFVNSPGLAGFDLVGNAAPGSQKLHYYINNGAYYQAGTSILPSNTWIHVAITKKAGETKTTIYVNGIAEQGSTGGTLTSVPATSSTLIGASQFGTRWHFNGLIDEVAVYNQALDAQTISAHAAGGDYCAAAPPVEPVCGNSILETGEVCDSNQQTCTTAQGYSGNQACNAQCTGYDACTTSQSCGDGIINGGEVCDGTNFNGATCADYVSGGIGSLFCEGNCLYIDPSGCVAPSCTDGIQNQGEIDIDCGGPCGACNVGQICYANTDCLTNLCSISNICVAGGPAMPACDVPGDLNGDNVVNVLDQVIGLAMSVGKPFTADLAGCEHQYVTIP